jgi:hypothetical protein
VQVRMMKQFLIPGVQYRQKSYARAEVTRVRRDGKQRLRYCAEEHAVDRTRILKRQRGQFLQQGEDDVAVRNR